jgi:hypothetical protein
MDSSGQMLESAVPVARNGEGFCVNYCIPQLPNGQLRSDAGSVVPAARKGEGFCVNYCIPQLPNGQLRSDD